MFDGQYKLVRKAGAPWEAQLSDIIVIDVKKNTTFDVPVNPYFDIHSASFQKVSGTITAKFTIDKIVGSANIGLVCLVFGKYMLTDDKKNENDNNGAPISFEISTITIGQEATATVAIPAKLVGEEYIFARVDVRATVSNEYCFTQVQKVYLK